jgi:uncharacterized protein YjbI with pentapeptide repeats
VLWPFWPPPRAPDLAEATLPAVDQGLQDARSSVSVGVYDGGFQIGSGVNVAGTNIAGLILAGASLTGTNLAGADLTNNNQAKGPSSPSENNRARGFLG